MPSEGQMKFAAAVAGTEREAVPQWAKDRATAVAGEHQEAICPGCNKFAREHVFGFDPTIPHLVIAGTVDAEGVRRLCRTEPQPGTDHSSVRRAVNMVYIPEALPGVPAEKRPFARYAAIIKDGAALHITFWPGTPPPSKEKLRPVIAFYLPNVREIIYAGGETA